MHRPRSESILLAVKEKRTFGIINLQLSFSFVQLCTHCRYPAMHLDSDGNKVAIVGVPKLLTYIGHLLVEFDEAGRWSS